MGKLLSKIFGNKEMRILMLGLDAAGKTSILFSVNKQNFSKKETTYIPRKWNVLVLFLTQLYMGAQLLHLCVYCVRIVRLIARDIDFMKKKQVILGQLWGIFYFYTQIYVIQAFPIKQSGNCISKRLKMSTILSKRFLMFPGKIIIKWESVCIYENWPLFLFC